MKLVDNLLLVGLTLISLSSCGIAIEDPSNSSNNFVRDIEIRINGSDNLVAGLFQYAESGLYYILTESKFGIALKDAYFVLSDSSKRLIDDIKEFAITNDIIAIEVNFIPGIPLEGFSLNA